MLSTSTMSNQDSTIKELCVRLQAVRDFAYRYYSEEVKCLLADASPSQTQVEHLMDGLLDFCGEERFLLLFKEICRHLLPSLPSTVQEYIQLYRTQYEELSDDICNV